MASEAGRPQQRAPDRRLQQLGGAVAVAAGLLTALAGLGRGVPAWLATSGAVAGALLLAVAAVLLVKAFVGDRAPLSWAKLGGILLLIYSVSWLVTLAMPLLLPPGDAAVATTTGTDAVRVVVGLGAGCAIAARWPVHGFDRWSMLLVTAADVVAQLAWFPATVGSVPLLTVMSLAWPLSVVALGLGHALTGRRRLRLRSTG